MLEVDPEDVFRVGIAVGQAARPLFPDEPGAAGQRFDDAGDDLVQKLVLVRAAADGDMAALRRLLDAGMPVDTRDAQGRTALLAATHADRVDAARVLIASAAPT